MTADDLRYLMRKDPFEPFRIQRKDGKSFVVPDMGWLLVADDFVIVGVAKSRRTEVPDKSERIPIAEIIRAEIVKRRKR